MNKYQEAYDDVLWSNEVDTFRIDPTKTRDEKRAQRETNFQLLQELVSKAIPITPLAEEEFVEYGDDDCGTQVRYYCPICHREVYIGQSCSNNECRQALDWSEYE